MEIVSFVFLGMVLGIVIHPVVVGLLRSAGCVAENYRGRPVVNLAGLGLIVIWLAGALVIFLSQRGPAPRDVAALTILIVAAGLFGALDDILGDRQVRGFRGHFGQLAKGRVTTGAIKAIGITATAVGVGALYSGTIPELALNVLVIALSVNAFNLLDLRPGRALKVFIALQAIVLLFALPEQSNAAAFLLGASVIILGWDLAEKSMLGDTGSNVLGAVIGFGFMVNFSVATKTLVLFVLVALHLIAERYSITEVVSKVGFLRRLDEIGRKED